MSAHHHSRKTVAAAAHADNSAAQASSPDGLGPDLNALPVRVDRRLAAELVSRWFFPVSRRTLETWPLSLQRVNGKATILTSELVELARAKLDAAPIIRGGRRPKPTA